MPVDIERIMSMSARFDGLVYDATCEPFIDDPSAAIVWKDEAPMGGFDTAIRYIWRHRVFIMRGESGPYPELWEAAGKAFPNWPGFRGDRCTANAETAELLDELESRGQ